MVLFYLFKAVRLGLLVLVMLWIVSGIANDLVGNLGIV